MMKLTRREIDRRLHGVPGWSLSGDENRIEIELFFRSFRDAMTFVARAAAVAEELEHVPDIDVRGTRVRLSLTTHDVGGLTDDDFRLARAVNGLLAGSSGGG